MIGVMVRSDPEPEDDEFLCENCRRCFDIEVSVERENGDLWCEYCHCTASKPADILDPGWLAMQKSLVDAELAEVDDP